MNWKNGRVLGDGCVLLKRKESDEQIAVIQWLDGQYPGILRTISPIVALSKRVNKYGGVYCPMGNKLKKMGYLSGTPDLTIHQPCGKYYGLFIELKKEMGGKVSDEQKAFLNKAETLGYKAVVCRGADEAINAIKSYMALTQSKE